jgi:glyoxylase I family protein
LGVGYALSGRVAEALPLLEQAVSMGFTPYQVVVISAGNLSLEIFPAVGEAPTWPARKARPEYHGPRHLASLVDDLDAKLAELGDRVKIDLGPLDLSQYIQGMRVAWVADLEGNILELNQGYVDEETPPPLT